MVDGIADLCIRVAYGGDDDGGLPLAPRKRRSTVVAIRKSAQAPRHAPNARGPRHHTDVRGFRLYALWRLQGRTYWPLRNR